MFGRDRAAHQSTVFFIWWVCPTYVYEKKKPTKKDTVKVDLSRTEKTNENKEETKEEENENA